MKESVTLLWLSPSDLDRDVLFRVTVVQDYSTFWVGYDTPVVRVLREARPEEPAAEVPPPPPPTRQPATTETEPPAATEPPAVNRAEEELQQPVSANTGDVMR